METRYNVMYDRGDGTTSLYLAMNCDYATAEKSLVMFQNRYMTMIAGCWIGREYPNKQGRYPFCDPRIVGIREDGSMFFA